MERKVAELELGLFTSGYQRYPLEQAFEDASRFGYDYIELWGGYPHAYVEDLTDSKIPDACEMFYTGA